MMIRPALALLPLLAALPLCAATGAGPSYCAAGKPESVLDCLSSAYQARDIKAYSRLLAPDFQFKFVDAKTGKPGQGWGRADDIQGTDHLFAGKDVASIRQVVTASNPPVQTGLDTWEISGVLIHLTVKKVDPAQAPLDVDGDEQLFRIRAVAAPKPHFEIYEWVDKTN